jgi:hypothetical protein
VFFRSFKIARCINFPVRTQWNLITDWRDFLFFSVRYESKIYELFLISRSLALTPERLARFEEIVKTERSEQTKFLTTNNDGRFHETLMALSKSRVIFVPSFWSFRRIAEWTLESCKINARERQSECPISVLIDQLIYSTLHSDLEIQKVFTFTFFHADVRQ